MAMMAKLGTTAILCPRVRYAHSNRHLLAARSKRFHLQPSPHFGLKCCSLIRLGLGTTIKLYLPRNLDESSSAKDMLEREVAPPRGEEQTVLVVDLLKELGYRVIEAIDGAEAMPVIEGKGRLDLLVSDIGLPGLNGRQLAEIAIATRPSLKILFITGYSATAASRADFLAPGMEMITKPFAIDSLAKKVSEMLNARP